MIKHLVPEKWDLEVDCSSWLQRWRTRRAIMACDLGLSAVVLEKSDVIGGPRPSPRGHLDSPEPSHG